MVAKKPKSKRLTTRHRAKIDRKARETHRKQRRDAKKSGKVSKQRRKDPGVPAMIPMREAWMEKMRDERAKEIAQKAARKSAMFEETQMAAESGSLERLIQSAQSAADSFNAASDDISKNDDFSAIKSNTFDNSRRAFHREFREVFESADVILMVLDARDPQGCRVREVEEAILSTGGKKRLVMVLNKIDLVPRENVQGWIKVIQREFPCVAFKASTQESRTHLSQSAHTSGSEAYGADGLLQLLKNYARSGNLNKKLRVRVGVVGYPNVGKSSLINSLKRSRVCNVGATPGVTTARQEVHLDSTVSLIDCPGIVFDHTDASSALRNCLKVEQLEDPVTPALEALSRIDLPVLQRLYTLPEISAREPSQILSLIAKRLGKLKRGGVPDMEATARHILNDWNQGKISFFTPVPTEKPHLLTQAEVVTEFAPRFDLFTNEDGMRSNNNIKEYSFEDSTTNMQIDDIDSEEIDSDVSDESDSEMNDESDIANDSQNESDITNDDFDSEDEVNFQHNQMAAKNFKAAQKKQAKQARRAMQQ